jgi:hypothetical protein
MTAGAADRLERRPVRARPACARYDECPIVRPLGLRRVLGATVYATYVAPQANPQIFRIEDDAVPEPCVPPAHHTHNHDGQWSSDGDGDD